MDKELVKETELIRSSNLFPVVGVGASAGGLDAFKRFLKAIPEKSGMAYIIVQHLDPGHDSILDDLLQRVTSVPVVEITDNVIVEPDHIYVIPPNQLLTATDGVLQLNPRPKDQRNMPIDILFISLAEVHQSQAIGVVLSGTGADGTSGLKAIKDNGGITFAQSPGSASYDGMPLSAIDSGVVDFILPPENIPGQLLKLNNTFRNSVVDEEGKLQRTNEECFSQILSILKIRRGVDFTHYKQSTVRRRITRRIALSMNDTLINYLAYLKDNLEEQDTLFQDLLIPVTQFFRDTKVFEMLCEKVFPALLKDKSHEETLRIWIAGCSTGEEAYSVVMCLHEYLGEKTIDRKVQVFATDISDIAISKARSGSYSKSETVGLSAKRLHQFFTNVDGRFLLHKSIRDTCVFANHNFLKDPPFSRMDLISCRNSLIYVEPILQKNALTTFHYALKEKGFLVLGNSETTAQAANLFSTYDKNCKIYTPKPVKGKISHLNAGNKSDDQKPGLITSGKENNNDAFQKNADEILLARFAPPGVVINSDMDIVQFRGATGMWLEPSPGKPSLNVLKMIRDDLAFELRNAIHKVKISKEAFIKDNIPVQSMGMERLVAIEVIPLMSLAELHFLVLFKDEAIPADAAMHQVKTDQEGNIVPFIQSKDQLRIVELQRELAATREDMRSITEEQEAANEELQSANEELISGSEEMQSLNEELENSKEEIQTSNEELIIVNQELYDRNEQLNLSRLYAESIVTTIREPLIILGKDLKIRSANRSFYQNFKTTMEGTVGKYIFDLGNKQWDIPALRKLLENILPENASINDFEVAHDFPSLGLRVMILNATIIFRENTEEQLILLAIEDITEKKKIDDELRIFTEKLEKQVLDRTFLLNESNIDLLHSNENLEQFAYIASHDLQEPLRKIRTFSTTLQDKYSRELPVPAKELIRKIITSSDRMSMLIKAVLNFSKILHGDPALEKTDLNEIMDKITDDFELMIAEKNAIIVRRKRLPTIQAIPLQINQLFYNLMSNSLKYCRSEIAPVITISSKLLSKEEVQKYPALDQERSYCEICFKDNGIGFQQQFADQIFLIFNRLHGREHFSGTGIGLALCKKIVLSHHGEIYATSNENEGAVFQILLPVGVQNPTTSIS
ncbi:MAG: chemotaxis protein CheB [Sediminibacterium sp.]